MKSSLPNTPLIATISLIFLVSLLISAVSAEKEDRSVTYHGGPLLTGNVSLAILWYGRFRPNEKRIIRTFIESLDSPSLSYEPDVSFWWAKVESFSKVAKVNGGGKISVKIAREIDDEEKTVGTEVTTENLPAIIKKATAGLANSIAVVFTSNDVSVAGTCEDMCFLKGAQGKQLYIVVGDPEENCPGVCALPFHRPDIWVANMASMTLEPPNWFVGIDSMVINLASALVETVTNPFNDGFYYNSSKVGFSDSSQNGATRGCRNVFGPQAFPGFPGNVRVDSTNGGAFNAHGNDNTKYLLPAVVDPETGSCWTTLKS